VGVGVGECGAGVGVGDGECGAAVGVGVGECGAGVGVGVGVGVGDGGVGVGEGGVAVGVGEVSMIGVHWAYSVEFSVNIRGGLTTSPSSIHPAKV